MSKPWLLAVIPLLYSASGCSQAESAAAASVALSATKVASTIPSLPGVPTENQSKQQAPLSTAAAPAPTQQEPSASPSSTPAAPPLPDMGNLFAPPKLVVPEVALEPKLEPEPVPEPVAVTVPVKKPTPQLRLLGFIEVDGPKALLSIEGELKVVGTGDSPLGVQMLAIEPPTVTFRHGDDGEELQINLYDQPLMLAAAVGHDRSAGPGIPRGSANRPGTPPTYPGNPVPTPPTPQGPSFGGMLGPPGTPGSTLSGVPPLPAIPGFGAPPPPSPGNASSTKRATGGTGVGR